MTSAQSELLRGRAQGQRPRAEGPAQGPDPKDHHHHRNDGGTGGSVYNPSLLKTKLS